MFYWHCMSSHCRRCYHRIQRHSSSWQRLALYNISTRQQSVYVKHLKYKASKTTANLQHWLKQTVSVVTVSIKVIMPRPDRAEALSDDACMTSVCRVHLA